MLSLLVQVIVVSRMLGDVAVGIYAVSRSYMALIKATPNAGIMPTLVSYPRLRPIHFRMMSGFAWMAGSTQVIVALLGCLAFSLVYGPSPTIVAVALLSGAALFEGQQAPSEAFLMRKLDYRPIITADALALAANLTVIFSLNKVIDGFAILTTATYAEAITRFVALKIPTWNETKSWWPRMKILRKVLIYVLKIMVSNIFSIISMQADKIIVNGFIGPAASAHFWRSQNLINVPITAYGRVVNRVLMPAIAHQKTSGVSSEGLVNLALSTSTRIGLLSGVALYTLSDALVSILLGPGWGGTASILQVTGALVVFRFTFKALDSLIVGKLHANTTIAGQAVLCCCTLLFMLIGVMQGGLVGAAWGLALAQAAAASFHLVAVLRHGMIRPAELVKTLTLATVESAVLSIPIFAAWWGLIQYKAPHRLHLLVLLPLLAGWTAFSMLQMKRISRRQKAERRAAEAAALESQDEDEEPIEDLHDPNLG